MCDRIFQKVAISESILKNLFNEAMGLKVLRFSFMTKGCSTTNYKVDTISGSFLLKLYPPQYENAREVFLMRILEKFLEKERENMISEDFLKLTSLILHRNRIEVEGSRILGRPFIIGHIGEFIASEIFDIELNASASTRGHDGYFRSGQLASKTVNIKYYSRKGYILDMCKNSAPDYYLVLMGSSNKREIAPWDIETVYLFNSEALTRNLEGRVKIGVATSVKKEYWEAAMIYPNNTCGRINLTEDMLEKLKVLKPT